MERALAYAIAVIIGASLLAFVVIIIATIAGAGEDGGFGEGIWPVVMAVPTYGLPIGFVLLIVLLILSAVRRGRAAKGAGE